MLKLATGALRVGISARLAKQALADAFGLDVEAVEEVWHGLKPPFPELFDWAEGRAGQPTARDVPVFRPFMLAHPLDETRRQPRRLCGRMEMGRNPHPAGPRRRRDPPVQPHRRRYFGQLSRCRRGLRDSRRARRRTARPRHRPGRRSGPRRRRGELQRAPAAARPEEGQQGDAGRLSGIRPALRHLVRRRGGFARAGLDRAPQPPRRLRRPARSRALRPVAIDRSRQLRGARGSAPGRPRFGDRGADAQAPRFALCRRAPRRPVVQMEARSADRRLRADVRPARVGQALVLLFRFHLRLLDAKTASCCRSARPISASPTRN